MTLILYEHENVIINTLLIEMKGNDIVKIDEQISQC